MLKIKPFNVSSKQILEFVKLEIQQPQLTEQEIASDEPIILPTIQMENWIDVTGDTIHYKLNCLTDNSTVIDIAIPFNVITSAGNFSDQSLWTVKDSTMARIANSGETYTVTSADIISVYPTSLLDKPTLFSEKNGTITCPLKVFVPSTSSTINDLVLLTYSTDAESGVTTTVGGPSATKNNVIPFTEGSKFATQMQASITVTPSTSSSSAGDLIALEVSTNNTDISFIYAEQVSGFINKTKIPLTNGVGTIAINTEGMQAGDQVRVKFGWYSYTGVAEFVRTLS